MYMLLNTCRYKRSGLLIILIIVKLLLDRIAI